MRAPQIRAIAQIGSVVAGALRHADDPSSILAPLRTIASFDAAMLAVRDPITGRQRALVNEGYEPSLLSFINTEYLSCRTYEIARDHRRPMRMRDYGPDFYRTRVYREFLDGAGYREGVTLVLRSGGDPGRATGLLTMSFGESRAADDDAREAIELVAPSLGQLVDVGLAPTLLASLLGNGAAFVVDGSGATATASDDPKPAVQQPSPAAIAVSREFLTTRHASLKGYCWRRDDTVWERVHLLRLTEDQYIDGVRALLMLDRTPLPYGLTERELDVLTLVSRGLPNRAIGDALRTSPRTVGTHVEHLLLKTGLATRAGLASYAVEHGVLRLDL